MAGQHCYTAPQVRQLLSVVMSSWCNGNYLGVVVFLTVPFFLQAAHCCIHIAGLVAQYLKIKGTPFPSPLLSSLPSSYLNLSLSIAIQKQCKTYKYLVQIAETFLLSKLIQKSDWTKHLQWVHVYVATFVPDLTSPCENTSSCLKVL